MFNTHTAVLFGSPYASNGVPRNDEGVSSHSAASIGIPYTVWRIVQH